MIASFARATIYRLRADKTTDRYGNTKLDWTNADRKKIRPARVEPIPGTETFDVEGGKVVSRWSVSAPANADIDDADRVEHAGVTYDIDGTVERFPSPSGMLDHIQMTLKRVGRHGA